MGGGTRMKIIKLSDKQFNELEEFIEKECDYVSDIASEYIDSEIGNELIDKQQLKLNFN